MSINLSTYDNGYYGYMTQEVREAIGDMQNAGTFLGTFNSPTVFSNRSAAGQGEKGDWGLDGSTGAIYVYNEQSGQFVVPGITEAQVQTLIDGAGGYGGSTTLLSSDVAIAGGATVGVADPLATTAGWHFKNTANINDKINWYYLANSNTALTMNLGSLNGMYALVDVRAGGSPFFSVYTKPTGSGDAGGWYKSRLTYAPVNYDISSNIGGTILLYWGDDPGDYVGVPRVECTLDSFSSNGTQGAGEEVMFGALSTSTSYPAGTYDFVVSNLAYEYNNTTFAFGLSSPPPAVAESTPDDAFVRMDGVNDYLSLGGTGAILDYSATWTVACEIVELPSITTDAKFMTLFRSGNNALTLRRGGSNWGFYAAAGYYSVAQANTWYAPVAGSKVLFECNGTHISYWLDGVKRSHTAINSNYPSLHVNNDIEFGRGGIAFGQGAVVDFEGGVDNLLFTNTTLSASDKAEWFAGGDVTTHSYYAGARDFVPCGEGTFPNVVGEKGNVTGSLVNGTSDDFVERT
jgi:hypothetical protein